MNWSKRRAILICISLLLTFVLLRTYLAVFPGANLIIVSYNVHHMFTGLLLIVIAGMPLVLFDGQRRLLDLASIGFGVGLSMALDEWVYLIVTDGSDVSYLLPVSLWGGVVMVGLTCTYIYLLSLCPGRTRRTRKANTT